MALLNLFLAFTRIGMFAVGGAYSFLPLIEKEVVEKYSWLTKEEFLDVLGLVKVFPGAISIKYATYTGYKIAGILGAIVANIGNIFAPAVIVFFAFNLYIKYKNLNAIKNAFDMIQLAVFAMIISVAFQTINISRLYQPKNLLVVIISAMLFLFTKLHPAIIIISAGILGALLGK